jgi:protein involved in polysaccharide export with SLBB domain
MVSAVMLAGLFLAGCHGGPDRRFAEVPGMTGGHAQAQAQPQAAGGADVNSQPAPLGTDIIQVGDNLTVTFADLPGPMPIPPIEDKVRDDGTIRLIQNLTFKAAGKSRGDLEKEIHDTYVPKYYRTMSVQVQQKGNTQFYYVDGEVKRPDRQIYISRLTVLKAIASSNGFTDFARKRAVVLTRANGRATTIDCIKAQRDSKLDLEVYPGDKIYVPRKTNPFQQ